MTDFVCTECGRLSRSRGCSHCRPAGYILANLLHTESLLAELDSALSREALKYVRSARFNVETLARLEERKHSAHVLGDRSAA